MTIYATKEDFTNYFGEREAIELTNHESPDATTVNDSIISLNLEFASAEIDGYLPAHLQGVATANLKRMCLEITRYKLDKNRQREDVRQRYEDVIEQLKTLAKQTPAEMFGDSTTSGDGIQESFIASVPGALIFTQDSLRNF